MQENKRKAGRGARIAPRSGHEAGSKTVASFKALGRLATVPGAISVALLFLAFLMIHLDARYGAEFANFAGGFLSVPYETATAILTTIAGGALTTLGLVYSIVLVVFTTAAGNIGPRLLQRFNDDRLNQATAGIFGGTFLFALATLYSTAPDRVPILSLGVALFVSVLAVLQLLLFVQSAARSVTVDVEVAEISAQLENEIAKLVQEIPDTCERNAVSLPGFPTDADATIRTRGSGYVTAVLIEPLIDWAETHNCVLEMHKGPGDFVLEGERLAGVDRPLSTNERRLLHRVVDDAVSIRPSRTPDADLSFSVHLLVEIALRALSPGVNDTYTAIACVDRLSAAMAIAVREGLPGEVRRRDGRPRLVISHTRLSGLLNLGFGPLRRAAHGNVLMLAAILDALERLHRIAEPGGATARMLRRHAKLTFQAARASDLQKDDVAFLREHHARLYRTSPS